VVTVTSSKAAKADVDAAAAAAVAAAAANQSAPVDVLLWSGSAGSYLALQAALAAQEISSARGDDDDPSAQQARPVVLLTTFDPTTGLLMPTRGSSGGGGGSDALPSDDEPGSLRAVMSQAQALGRFDLLAAPVAVPVVAEPVPQRSGREAAVATAAWAAGVAAALAHLRASHGFMAQRLFVGDCSGDGGNGDGSGCSTDGGPFTGRGNLRNEALREALAELRLGPAEVTAPLAGLLPAALQAALAGSRAGGLCQVVDPRVVGLEARNAPAARSPERRRASGAEPPPLPRPREVRVVGPKPKRAAAVAVAPDAAARATSEGFVGCVSVTHVIF